MSKLTRLRKQCAETARAIGTLHHEAWPVWVLYIIEYLDIDSDKPLCEREWVLRGILNTLQKRLDEGSW